MADFGASLLAARERNHSLLCVGLDSEPSLLPAGLSRDATGWLQFNRAIIAATADLVCAYKPNLAFYEAHGGIGAAVLKNTLAAIPAHIPVIADAKRGDIANSAAAYSRAVFDELGCQAVTVNPYMGLEALTPFTERAGRGVFVLCRTSNPGAREFQSLAVEDPRTGERRSLFLQVAAAVSAANQHGNLGLVVGATYPEELAQVRAVDLRLPLLIPGVGAQAGDLRGAVQNGMGEGLGLPIINSARQILFASKEMDFASAARAAAQKLRDEINACLPH